MLPLSLLLSCGVSPDQPEEPVALSLPGQVVRGHVEVTDDGDVLTFQRRPTPIVDAILFFLFALMFPALAVMSGMVWSERRAQVAFVGMILGSDLWMIAMTRRVEVMTIDRGEQVVSLRYHLYIGVDLPTTQRTFSEVSRIGVVLIPGESSTGIALELTEVDRTRHRVQLEEQGEPDGMPYAVALRDHVAEVLNITHIEETRSRWR